MSIIKLKNFWHANIKFYWIYSEKGIILILLISDVILFRDWLESGDIKWCGEEKNKWEGREEIRKIRAEKKEIERRRAENNFWAFCIDQENNTRHIPVENWCWTMAAVWRRLCVGSYFAVWRRQKKVSRIT